MPPHGRKRSEARVNKVHINGWPCCFKHHEADGKAYACPRQLFGPNVLLKDVTCGSMEGLLLIPDGVTGNVELEEGHHYITVRFAGRHLVVAGRFQEDRNVIADALGCVPQLAGESNDSSVGQVLATVDVADFEAKRVAGLSARAALRMTAQSRFMGDRNLFDSRGVKAWEELPEEDKAHYVDLVLMEQQAAQDKLSDPSQLAARQQHRPLVSGGGGLSMGLGGGMGGMDLESVASVSMARTSASPHHRPLPPPPVALPAMTISTATSHQTNHEDNASSSSSSSGSSSSSSAASSVERLEESMVPPPLLEKDDETHSNFTASSGSDASSSASSSMSDGDGSSSSSGSSSSDSDNSSSSDEDD